MAFSVIPGRKTVLETTRTSGWVYMVAHVPPGLGDNWRQPYIAKLCKIIQHLYFAPENTGDLQVNSHLNFRTKIWCSKWQKTFSNCWRLSWRETTKYEMWCQQSPIHVEGFFDLVVWGSDPCRCRLNGELWFRSSGQIQTSDQSWISIALVIYTP